MTHKISKWLLCLINLLSLVLLVIPAVRLLGEDPSLICSLLPVIFQQEEGKESGISSLLLSSEVSQKAETVILEKLEETDELWQLQVKLKRFSGQTLQDGIFLTDNAMYENIDPPNDEITASNVNGMLEFVYRYYIPTYTVIVPTACAVKQDDIPPNAPLFNQKSYIDEIYRKISGVITAGDVYSVLFASMDEYIYYRTHPELTGLGGYYVYTVLADKMSFRQRTLAQFEQNYLKHDFYGELYERIPYSSVQPDTIGYYRMTLFDRQYTLTRYNQDGTISIYDDLIVPEKLEEGETQAADAILGGPAPMMTIRVESPYRERLLIFSDQTVKAYIPFLAAEYSEITIVDLTTVTEKQLKSLAINRYDQILFSYSLDTFSQQDFGEPLLYLANR